MRCLLDHGADINARDSDNWTPLRWATTEWNNVQVLRLLLERGADANARDNRGKTPSQYMITQEIADLLSKYANYGTQSVD